MNASVPLLLLFNFELVYSNIGLNEQFEQPRQLTAAGQPMDVQRIGHAAPFVGDFDNDGLDDLLLGEFYQGRMRVFRNLGSAAKPQFDNYEWFRTGSELGRVPVD